MNMTKALWLIFAGMMLLTAVVCLPLASIHADGTAYALAMVFVISMGGFANYLAFKRYGSVSPRRRH
jgi:bacteriorhodopsin